MILTVTIDGVTARIPYSIEPRRVNVGVLTAQYNPETVA